MIDINPTRPLLRYHGGKWRLAPWIVAHFPPHRVYVEPFGGAASVLLRKPRSYAEVYNDLDGEIVSLFRVLRDPTQARELERRLRLTPFARDEFDAAYGDVDDPIERARFTIIKSFMGFGSDGIVLPTGFRSNSNRSGTTPSHDWANYPAQIEVFSKRLSGVVVENRDALDVMAAHDSRQTLHYVDPPYPHVTRWAGERSRAYRHEMTDDQHRALAAYLRGLKGAVILSCYPCDLYDELYADWRRVELRAHADGAKDRTEVLWLSPGANPPQGSLW